MTGTQKPFLVGISGGSGSGKTTLAERLAARLAPRKSTIVSEDRYYKDTRGLKNYDPRTYNFDVVDSRDYDLLEMHLNELKSGKAIDAPRYSFATHTRLADTDRITPTDVMIFEGIHVLSTDRIRNIFDLTIYVDTPDDIRFLRRILRDTKPESEGGRSRDWRGVVEQYLTTVRKSHAEFTAPAREKADIVLFDECTDVEKPALDIVDKLLEPVFKSPKYRI